MGRGVASVQGGEREAVGGDGVGGEGVKIDFSGKPDRPMSCLTNNLLHPSVNLVPFFYLLLHSGST